MGKVYVIAAAASLLIGSAHAAVPAGAARLDVKSVYGLGRCIVDDDREAAGALLRELPLADADVALDAGRLGEAANCLKGASSSVSSTSLRGALAQALLLRDFPRFGVPPKISERLFVKFDYPLEPQAAPTLDPSTVTLYKLAECVVRNQAIKTETLFRSAPGSGAESRVLDSFGPTLAACQGTDTRPVRVSRAKLRSLMAQAAYMVSVRYWTGQLWSAS